MKCSRCNGSGMITIDDAVDECEVCDGQGQKENPE